MFAVAAVVRTLSVSLFAVGAVYGQASILSCQASANPPLIRAEGITERLGDINLYCFGGQPNAIISGNLNIFLNVAISNRITENGTADAYLLVDNGSGFVPANVPARPGPSLSLVWAGLQVQLSNEGKVNLRIQNVRAAAAQLNPDSISTVVANLTFNSGALVSFLTNGFVIGTVQRGLYATNSTQLLCSNAGSPSPHGLSFTGALAQGTAYSTVRVTEGFPSAFAPEYDFQNQHANSGTRILVRYDGLPAGARIYTPVTVAGRDALEPTSAGDFGVTRSGGNYVGGSGSLLLTRVLNADRNGAGGQPAQIVKPGFNFINDVLEISYNGDGSGYAVFEVLDADNARIQSALITSLLALEPYTLETLTTIRQSIYFAAASTLQELRTLPGSHVPRFVTTLTPPADCRLLNDCNASYFPRLSVNQSAIEVVTDSGKNVEYRYISISNPGSGNLMWTASTRYVSGPSGSWLKVGPTAGINQETLRVEMRPFGLAPGVYEAIVTIDSGAVSGQWNTKITMRVSQGAPPQPVIQSITNAANKGVPGPLVAGSLASITGIRFSANSDVYFNGVQGRLVYGQPNELLVQIPAEIGDMPNANTTVISDGVASASYYTYFAKSAPAIFPNYLVNADGLANGPTSPVIAGTELQIFGTGLPKDGVYTAKIHDRDVWEPVYAGDAPGLVGVQLVTIVVPRDLPSMTTHVYLCGGPSLDNQSCSAPRDVTIQQAPAAAPEDEQQ